MAVIIDGTNGFKEPTGYLFGPPQGRLTLTTGTPVMTSTVSAATTIYYTPYNGNLIPIYNGTAFVPTLFTNAGVELSIATTNTANSPAAIGASKVNDWFVWDDAGTIRLVHGPDWTSDTSRSAGTAIALVNGIYTNSVAITNGPAISKGTYVGTTRSNSSSQLDWILGTAAAGGGAAFLWLWNAYNQKVVRTQVRDTDNSWSVAATAIATANSSTGNRVSFVQGLPWDACRASYGSMHGGATAGEVGVGFNSTTAYSGRIGSSAGGVTWSEGSDVQFATGANWFQALNGARVAGTETFYGDNNTPTQVQNGLIFEGSF